MVMSGGRLHFMVLLPKTDIAAIGYHQPSTGSEVIKLISCSAQLRLKFIPLINVKMPTIVGILTSMSRINYWLSSFKPPIFHIQYLGYFYIFEQLRFHAQLS